MNERIKEIDDAHAIPADNVWEFLCECGNADCTEKISLTPAEYEGVRFDPTHFALLPGHERLEAERIVHRTDRFLTVEKTSQDGFARRTDPRS